MSEMQRVTLYLNAQLYRTLKIAARFSGRMLSEFVNDAVAASLKEDAIDSETIGRRAKEPNRTFSTVLRNLERHKTTG